MLRNVSRNVSQPEFDDLPMAATIKDIARQLSISTSTVSYALNGGPRTVPEEVRQRVLDTARALGYRPNRIARSLVTGRNMTIGVVPSEAAHDLTLIPHFHTCFNGIVNEAEKSRQDVLMFTRASAYESEDLFDSLHDGRIDGVIFVAPRTDLPLLCLFRDSQLPFVLVSSDAASRAPAFTCDNREGITQAVDHLISLGHTKIAHIHGMLSLQDGIERLRAFRDAMLAAGLELRDDWILDGQFSPIGGYEAANRLLNVPDRPTAIVCANDEIAVGVYRAVWERNLRIPDTFSVVGFDDALAGRITLPPLTTVRQPIEQMGAAALRALIDLIEGRPAHGRSFGTDLIVRESTCRPKEDIT